MDLERLMYENAHGYHFMSIEEMQSYVQEHGPLKDGVDIIVAGERLR